MYVCVYVYMYVCMCVYVCTGPYPEQNPRGGGGSTFFINIFVTIFYNGPDVYMCVCMCMYVCMYVSVYVNVYVCMYVCFLCIS